MSMKHRTAQMKQREPLIAWQGFILSKTQVFTNAPHRTS